MSSVANEWENMKVHDGGDTRPGYDEAAVSDAQYMMEALHGDSAPMLAVAIACDRLLDGKPQDTKFWMRVYRALIAGELDCGADRVLH